ncbi:MAG: SDR family NAD(P)-dependent oxidoreductase [Novosphingobium sp.]
MTDWALITGGSRNIGAAIAERSQADGFKVMVASRTPPEHENFDEFVAADFEDPEGAAQVLGEAIGSRPVTRFVHNAAVSNLELTEDVPIEDFLRVYKVNTASFVSLSQKVIPIMRERGVGRIVAIGSRAALGKIRRSAYAASKSALDGLVRTMALELGGAGITVNAVFPGPVETSLFRQSTLPGSLDYKNLNEGIPVGFIGEPHDIAHAVSYFLSDQARFTTGQVLLVCGGTSIGFVSGEDRQDHLFASHYPQPE